MAIQATLNDSIAAIRTIFDLEAKVALASDLLRKTLLSGHKARVCGSGAANSAHFATELACRFVSDRRPYSAISSSVDSFCHGVADVELLIPQQVTARIQEAHKIIIHLLCELVEPDLAKE